jgi:hypothetical protein
MLPFRVIQLERYRALQESASAVYLSKPFHLAKRRSERNFATSSSGSYGALNGISSQFWPKNRNHRKQTIKPCLTGSKLANKEFRKFAKMEPQNRDFSAQLLAATSRGTA